jgi:sugar lactone lactonase YvrE
LIRSNSLLEAYPGKTFYAVDEYYKRTVQYNVSSEGYISNPVVFAEKGEYSVTSDKEGNVYIPDGEIYVYDKNGKMIDEIAVPERPACIIFGGKDQSTLYVTARSSLYMIHIKDV